MPRPNRGGRCLPALRVDDALCSVTPVPLGVAVLRGEIMGLQTCDFHISTRIRARLWTESVLRADSHGNRTGRVPSGPGVSTQIRMLPKGQSFGRFTQMRMLPKRPACLLSFLLCVCAIIGALDRAHNKHVGKWPFTYPHALSPAHERPKRQERRRARAWFVAGLGAPTSVVALDRSPGGAGGGWSGCT